MAKLTAPSGKPHPQYILDYIEAFNAAHPNSEVPTIWDRGNGWIEYRPSKGVSVSIRKSQLSLMTNTMNGLVRFRALCDLGRSQNER